MKLWAAPVCAEVWALWYFAPMARLSTSHHPDYISAAIPAYEDTSESGSSSPLLSLMKALSWTLIGSRLVSLVRVWEWMGTLMFMPGPRCERRMLDGVYMSQTGCPPHWRVTSKCPCFTAERNGTQCVRGREGGREWWWWGGRSVLQSCTAPCG